MTSNNQPAKNNPACMSVLVPLFENPLPNKIPYWEVSASDTPIAHLSVAGSLDPEESWSHGVLFHSLYFMFHISPTIGVNKLAWEPREKIRINIRARDSVLRIANFSDYTRTPKQCATRMRKWLKTIVTYLAK
jgi:hypothetical protein